MRVNLAAHCGTLSGLAGPVKLLTNPVSAGYVINPISVYYCYSKAGALDKCIAEVCDHVTWRGAGYLTGPKDAQVTFLSQVW